VTRIHHIEGFWGLNCSAGQPWRWHTHNEPPSLSSGVVLGGGRRGGGLARCVLPAALRAPGHNYESVVNKTLGKEEEPEFHMIRGPQTTAHGPDPARLHIWTGPLNNTRDAFRFIIFSTLPAAVEIAVRRGENVEWCSSQ